MTVLSSQIPINVRRLDDDSESMALLGEAWNHTRSLLFNQEDIIIITRQDTLPRNQGGQVYQNPSSLPFFYPPHNHTRHLYIVFFFLLRRAVPWRHVVTLLLSAFRVTV